MPDENGNAKTIDFYPYSRAHAPSGAFYSSAKDMARFAIANMNQGDTGWNAGAAGFSL